MTIYSDTSDWSDIHLCYCDSTQSNHRPTIGEQKLGKSSDCRPILADTLVSQRLFQKFRRLIRRFSRSLICDLWDRHLLIDRHSAEIFVEFTSGIGRMSPAYQSSDNKTESYRISTDDCLLLSIWSPDCQPIISIGSCYIVCNACFTAHMEFSQAFLLFVTHSSRPLLRIFIFGFHFNWTMTFWNIEHRTGQIMSISSITATFREPQLKWNIAASNEEGLQNLWTTFNIQTSSMLNCFFFKER